MKPGRLLLAAALLAAAVSLAAGTAEAGKPRVVWLPVMRWLDPQVREGAGEGGGRYWRRHCRCCSPELACVPGKPATVALQSSCQASSLLPVSWPADQDRPL